MKHPASQALFAYWDDKRGGARAPERQAFEPAEIRELLGDIFVLSYQRAVECRFRVAGTRVCALLGRDLKGESFAALFAAESRGEIEDLLGLVAEDALTAVAGLSAATSDGSVSHLELLLLPFNARAHSPLTMTGLLAPLDLGHRNLGEFRLTSWRTLRPPQRLGRRSLRKFRAAPGLTVYEGVN
ncbi:PAS domain-containing protein [Rhodopseudomonas palustris]|uniref:PAS domain-containing protein n=1 Tax=Rhodopseudomonas palustris (strain BisB18) TaxID=316056 RepID=Q212L4_RHOPB